MATFATCTDASACTSTPKQKKYVAYAEIYPDPLTRDFSTAAGIISLRFFDFLFFQMIFQTAFYLFSSTWADSQAVLGAPHCFSLSLTSFPPPLPFLQHEAETASI